MAFNIINLRRNDSQLSDYSAQLPSWPSGYLCAMFHSLIPCFMSFLFLFLCFSVPRCEAWNQVIQQHKSLWNVNLWVCASALLSKWESVKSFGLEIGQWVKELKVAHCYWWCAHFLFLFSNIIFIISLSETSSPGSRDEEGCITYSFWGTWWT